MNLQELLNDSKQCYIKAAKLERHTDPHTLGLFMREIEKSFLYSCEECEQWKVEFKDEGDYILLSVSCRAYPKGESK